MNASPSGRTRKCLIRGARSRLVFAAICRTGGSRTAVQDGCRLQCQLAVRLQVIHARMDEGLDGTGMLVSSMASGSSSNCSRKSGLPAERRTQSFRASTEAHEMFAAMHLASCRRSAPRRMRVKRHREALRARGLTPSGLPRHAWSSRAAADDPTQGLRWRRACRASRCRPSGCSTNRNNGPALMRG